MTPLHALEASIAIAQAVFDAAPISDADHRRPTPCREFDVAALGSHIIDTHHLLLGAAGGGVPDPEGSLSERHGVVGAASIARWTTRGADGTIDVGGNELPASFGLSLHTLETYVHGWDLAQALGRPFRPSSELAEMAWTIAQHIVSDELRGDNAPYGPAVATADGDDLVARVMAHTGRDPHRPVRLDEGASHV